MTAKIAPDHGNPMTATEHRRFSDRGIAGAAMPTTTTESSAPADPAFERHYRIGELAEMWQLGRETVRLLVKDERGVIKIRLGRKKAHTIYSVPESVAVPNPHPPAQQPLVRRFTLIERPAATRYRRPPETPTRFDFSL